MGQLLFLHTVSQDVDYMQSSYHLFAKLLYIPQMTLSIAYAFSPSVCVMPLRVIVSYCPPFLLQQRREEIEQRGENSEC